MEIEIQSKTDNLLLGRTEVRFVIHHEGEGTPKRELVRSELAEKLNAKKETIMVNDMHSSFGTRKTIGYAKIYKSIEDAKKGEADPIETEWVGHKEESKEGSCKGRRRKERSAQGKTSKTRGQEGINHGKKRSVQGRRR
jgi:small subunit ribosomal protein S24e